MINLKAPIDTTLWEDLCRDLREGIDGNLAVNIWGDTHWEMGENLYWNLGEVVSGTMEKLDD